MGEHAGGPVPLLEMMRDIAIASPKMEQALRDATFLVRTAQRVDCSLGSLVSASEERYTRDPTNWTPGLNAALGDFLKVARTTITKVAAAAKSEDSKDAPACDCRGGVFRLSPDRDNIYITNQHAGLHKNCRVYRCNARKRCTTTVSSDGVLTLQGFGVVWLQDMTYDITDHAASTTLCIQARLLDRFAEFMIGISGTRAFQDEPGVDALTFRCAGAVEVHKDPNPSWLRTHMFCDMVAYRGFSMSIGKWYTFVMTVSHTRVVVKVNNRCIFDEPRPASTPLKGCWGIMSFRPQYSQYTHVEITNVLPPPKDGVPH